MPNTLTSIFVSTPATEPVEAPHPNTGVYVTGTQATVGGPWTVVHTLITRTTTPLTMVGRLKNFPTVTVAVVAAGGPNAGNIFNNILATPTGTAATATSSTALNVVVSSIANQTGYRLLSCDTQTGTYTQIYQSTTASYPHTGLTASQTKWYKWQYVGGGFYDDSPLSAAFSGITQTATAQGPAPAAPTNPGGNDNSNVANFTRVPNTLPNAYEFQINAGGYNLIPNPSLVGEVVYFPVPNINIAAGGLLVRVAATATAPAGLTLANTLVFTNAPGAGLVTTTYDDTDPYLSYDSNWVAQSGAGTGGFSTNGLYHSVTAAAQVAVMSFLVPSTGQADEGFALRGYVNRLDPSGVKSEYRIDGGAWLLDAAQMVGTIQVLLNHIGVFAAGTHTVDVRFTSLATGSIPVLVDRLDIISRGSGTAAPMTYSLSPTLLTIDRDDPLPFFTYTGDFAATSGAAGAQFGNSTARSIPSGGALSTVSFPITVTGQPGEGCDLFAYTAGRNNSISVDGSAYFPANGGNALYAVSNGGALFRVRNLPAGTHRVTFSTVLDGTGTVNGFAFDGCRIYSFVPDNCQVPAPATAAVINEAARTFTFTPAPGKTIADYQVRFKAAAAVALPSATSTATTITFAIDGAAYAQRDIAVERVPANGIGAGIPLHNNLALAATTADTRPVNVIFFGNSKSYGFRNGGGVGPVNPEAVDTQGTITGYENGWPYRAQILLGSGYVCHQRAYPGKTIADLDGYYALRIKPLIDTVNYRANIFVFQELCNSIGNLSLTGADASAQTLTLCAKAQADGCLAIPTTGEPVSFPYNPRVTDANAAMRLNYASSAAAIMDFRSNADLSREDAGANVALFVDGVHNADIVELMDARYARDVIKVRAGIPQSSENVFGL